MEPEPVKLLKTAPGGLDFLEGAITGRKMYRKPLKLLKREPEPEPVKTKKRLQGAGSQNQRPMTF